MLARDRRFPLILALGFVAVTLLTSGPAARRAIGGKLPSVSLNRPQGRTRTAPVARQAAMPSPSAIGRGGPKRPGPSLGVEHRPAVRPAPVASIVADFDRRPRAPIPLRC